MMKKHEKNNKPFQIEIDEEKYLIIKKWKKILINESIFRWAELVEKYNYSVINPIQKIDSFKEINGVKRDIITFTTHKDILQEFYNSINQSDEIECFYDSISLREISWDHYIPHSYMSYEDIWNLVPTSISLNSSKSNKYHDKFFNNEIIWKLYNRNDRLYKWLIDEKEQLVKEKKFKALDLEKIIFQFNSWKEYEKIKSKVEEFRSFDCI
ncbi:HNH endonuclease domain-containing protein [Mycoplasma sp. (ex Biomphalaria glabrata)]|uniref:HNH endonuclease domain-containing protein n=1 Tax=Mycoplasma sp. (ex Biomphalaria glabrata) TaxID=1749074 RepID=UPI000AF3CC58|nr:HNH endonuclease domain-containing protein [Mycoplasma sp. (ex Biomphalaria glabrata)]